MGVGRWEGAELPRRLRSSRGEWARPWFCFVSETIAVLNEKPERMMVTVSSLAKAAFPF